MDEMIYAPTFMLGILLLVIYICRCLKSKITPSLASALNILFLSSGVVAGAVLVACALLDIKLNLSQIRLYIIAGGVAVAWVSVSGIYGELCGAKFVIGQDISKNE